MRAPVHRRVAITGLGAVNEDGNVNGLAQLLFKDAKESK